MHCCYVHRVTELDAIKNLKKNYLFLLKWSCTSNVFVVFYILLSYSTLDMKRKSKTPIRHTYVLMFVQPSVKIYVVVTNLCDSVIHSK